MHYAGAYLVDQRRWFVYQMEAPIVFSEIREEGIVEYWRNGFRVTLPRERRALIFRRSGTTVPSGLSRSPFPTTSYAEGYGVVFLERAPRDGDSASGPITIQDYCSPEYSSCGPYDQDPIGGGGGGTGSSCLPRSCSVGCDIGSCKAECNPGFMAVCSCHGTSSAVCACLQC